MGCVLNLLLFNEMQMGHENYLTFLHHYMILGPHEGIENYAIREDH